jgi:hypothetical protein
MQTGGPVKVEQVNVVVDENQDRGVRGGFPNSHVMDEWQSGRIAGEKPDFTWWRVQYQRFSECRFRLKIGFCLAGRAHHSNVGAHE